MATLTIRNLNDDTKKRLRIRAAANGHSMEEEARQILDEAVVESREKGWGTRINKRFKEFADMELEIPERKPIDFEQNVFDEFDEPDA